MWKCSRRRYEREEVERAKRRGETREDRERRRESKRPRERARERGERERIHCHIVQAKKVENGQLAQWCLSDLEDPDELADSIDWPHEMKELILELEQKVLYL